MSEGRVATRRKGTSSPRSWSALSAQVSFGMAVISGSGFSVESLTSATFFSKSGLSSSSSMRLPLTVPVGRSDSSKDSSPDSVLPVRLVSWSLRPSTPNAASVSDQFSSVVTWPAVTSKFTCAGL